MKYSILAAGGLVVCAQTTMAAEGQQGEGWALPEVVVTAARLGYDQSAASSATRVATPVEEVPQSIQTLTRKLIEDQDLQNLTGALVNVSGVAPTSQAQTVLQPTLVRGFAVNYLIDGVPTYQLPAGVGDPATLVNVERIEVAKGPTATLYGGGTGAPLSGLINLVSRDPTDRLAGSAALRVGSFGTWGGSADLNVPLGDVAAFRISGMADSADSFIDHVTSDRRAVFPSLLLKLGSDTNLVIRGRYNHLAQTEYAGLPFEHLRPTTLIDREVYAGARDIPRTWVENKGLAATLTHAFSSWLDGSMTVNRSTSEFEEWATFPYGQLAGTVYNFGSAVLPSDSQKTYATASLTARLGEASLHHTVLVGVDYDHTDYFGAMDFNTVWATIDFADPLPAPAFGPVPPRFLEQDDRLETVAVFAQDQIGVGERLDLTLGVRWTQLKVLSNVGFATTDESYDKVTPRLGATYRLTDGVSLFAGYSQGFQGVVAGGFYGITPEPETSQSWEGGVKFHGLVPGLSGTVAVYQLTRQNVLTSIPNTFFYSQSGEQRARGTELDLIYEPSRSLSILINYAYTDAKVTEDDSIPVGDRLRAVPKQSGRVAARYRFAGSSVSGLEVGGGVTAVSRRELTLPNSLSAGGSILVDAQATYPVGSFTAGLSVTNLFGSKAYEPYQYFGGAYVTPTQSRAAFFTLRTQF
jgi:iron complex outermembrane receptor protein